MSAKCPLCLPHPFNRPNIVRRGRFWRKSDGRWITRFYCKSCHAGFSQATSDPCFRQNKRHKNEILRKLFCSGVSQRRAAKILNLNRITVVRKFLFLSEKAKIQVQSHNLNQPKCIDIQFDDLETFEHSKCKPLSITLAVESKTRRILGFEVSKMPAKGKLAAISVKKYGFRKDHRPLGRKDLFRKIHPFVEDDIVIRSDQNPHYPADVAKFFPGSLHLTCKGKRGAMTGQGELKKVRHDPIFSLNHTCAKLRADINRLVRRTWCTTKKIDRLTAHLHIYSQYHNQNLA